MKIKLLALLLMLTLAVTMLASCFGPKDDPKDPTECTTHIDNNGDKKCDNCQAAMPTTQKPGTSESGEELPAVTWADTTEILFQMTDDDQNGELSSGCRRFLSGESDGQSIVEVAARERNAKAYAYANVNVKYAYYPDGTAGWGQKITAMWSEATSDTAESRPDIFCNFVYDMVSSSLLKSFKNLYNNSYTSVGVKSGERLNYFSFAKDGKYDTTYVDTGDGYMIEYMQSLTLSETKMYLLASDYFTDLVRAFFAVPVNVALMEGGKITASTEEGAYNYDYNKNGQYDMVDFYQLVREGKWTYDAVKGFSKDVYVEGSDASNILDANGGGVYGWAVAAGGLGASGLLYTTSVTVIERKVEMVPSTDADANGALVQSYTYWYPEQAAPLSAFATELAALFSSTGVKCITVGINSTTSSSEELEVRRAFAANQVLFGGIVCVGSLEESAYGNMSSNGGKGFGVVPVPLFRTEHNVTVDGVATTVKDTYLTQIHNIGRIAGIAVKSTKFAQCSAFLNYQSLNSSKILDQYYNLTLKTDAAGAIEGNAEMLDYIRENVRSSFDKAFEDAIARHQLSSGSNTDTISLNNNKWHNLILHSNFVMEDGAMQEKYDSLVDVKDTYLQQLAQSYANLPE